RQPFDPLAQRFEIVHPCLDLHIAPHLRPLAYLLEPSKILISASLAPIGTSPHMKTPGDEACSHNDVAEDEQE
ncbi:MAG: hypothetical protein WBI00_02120, partial [Thermoanaerobaculia bacterium]